MLICGIGTSRPSPPPPAPSPEQGDGPGGHRGSCKAPATATQGTSAQSPDENVLTENPTVSQSFLFFLNSAPDEEIWNEVLTEIATSPEQAI